MNVINTIDLSKILRPFEGKWVALSLDYKKVLGDGDSLKETKAKAKKKSAEYIFIKLPPYGVSYVPSFPA